MPNANRRCSLAAGRVDLGGRGTGYGRFPCHHLSDPIQSCSPTATAITNAVVSVWVIVM